MGLLALFGTLAVLKYFNFAVSLAVQVAALFGASAKPAVATFFVPLGISFYTFSAASYLFDVYNNKIRALSNPLKLALCISYFPSIVQGPINRFGDLQKQFFASEEDGGTRRVSLQDAQFAIQRILWGFVKKLVIADRAAQVVSYIFTDYSVLPCYIVWAGLVCYSIELYADFAGGIDVALGVSELFGVRLKENFRQPYFSQSIAEFWRRWHITLGEWMRDYVFYPFSLSPFATRLSSAFPNNTPLGKHLRRTVPAAIANILVFLIVGLWHGAAFHFVVYGLFHGLIIASSVLLAPFYAKIITRLRIPTASFIWRAFRIVRTFTLVTLAGLVDDVENMQQSLAMTRQLFDFGNFALISNWQFKGFNKLTLAVITLFCIIWFVVSVQKENGVDVRLAISKKPVAVRWVVYLFLILAPPFFQSSHMAGFMYAMF